MPKFGRTSSFYAPRKTDPRRLWLQALWLSLAGVGVLLLNLAFPQLFSGVRVMVVDVATPLLHAAAVPLQQCHALWQGWVDADLRDENARLKKENAALRDWYGLAAQWGVENKNLRGLLKYKDDGALSYITARVIAEADGHFAHSVIVTAGLRDGVTPNMVALAEDGLVGRIIEAGQWSSRVLLLSDLNSRLPVLIEETGEPAILAGDGDNLPKLLYLSPDATLKEGMRIVTSGQGGIYPPHVAVGVIRTIDDRGGKVARIALYARLDRLTMLRLGVYALAGGQENPLNKPSATPQPPTTAPAPPPPASLDKKDAPPAEEPVPDATPETGGE